MDIYAGPDVVFQLFSGAGRSDKIAVRKVHEILDNPEISQTEIVIQDAISLAALELVKPKEDGSAR